MRSPQITSTLDDYRLRRSSNSQNSTITSPSRNLQSNNIALNRRSLNKSNGSLHSIESTNSQSSSNSPAPSPLPRPATIHSSTAIMPQQNNHPLTTQSSTSNLMMKENSTSPTGLGKRWNSTGDFSSNNATLQNNRSATKSLLNLQGKNSPGSSLKHG